MKLEIIDNRDEIVFDKKELWEMIRRCHIPYNIGNSHYPYLEIFDESPTECIGYYEWRWNNSFKYGKYWTVEYMWKLYVALRTLNEFTWEDIENVDISNEIEIPLTVKVRVKK